MGLSGEGKVEDSVWIVKTHYPERIGRVKFHSNKCIVIVRNPLDAIFSLFNMIGTMTHNESLSAEVLDKAMHHSSLWTDFIHQESEVWDEFHRFWLRLASAGSENDFPVHFITYEALSTDPEPALTDLFKFLLDAESLEGTTIAAKIKQVCSVTSAASEGQSKQVYKPRSGKINKNLQFYDGAQLEHLYTRCREQIHRFGYQEFFVAAGVVV